MMFAVLSSALSDDTKRQSDEVFTVKLEPSMKVSEPLQVWYSNYEVDPPVIFQQNASLTVGADRTITLPVRRGSMITISTVKTAKKGVAFHPPASKIQFPLPLEENMCVKCAAIRASPPSPAASTQTPMHAQRQCVS
jgi:hypothetical protein